MSGHWKFSAFPFPFLQEKLLHISNRYFLILFIECGRRQRYAEGRHKYNTNYIYGASKMSSRMRRCGECEGCIRKNCGKCNPCLDNPAFGGPGKKKQACLHRNCRSKIKPSVIIGREYKSTIPHVTNVCKKDTSRNNEGEFNQKVQNIQTNSEDISSKFNFSCFAWQLVCKY